jgi:cytochrome c peroxidase
LLASAATLACGSSGRAPASGGDGDAAAPVLTDQQRAALEALSPQVLPAPAADPSNRWADDATAAGLGRSLFFDGGLSGKLLDGDNDGSVHALGQQGETGKVACAGCHVPESAFTDTRTIRQQISLGAGWGKRRAPSLLDVGQSKLLMWDGRHDALYNQVFSVIESPVEMNSSRLYVAHQVFSRYRAAYEALFGPMPPLDDRRRFPALEAAETGCQKLDATNACTTPMRGVPGDGAEFDGMSESDRVAVTRVVVNVGKALGAYQRLLQCGQSRFDRWIQGDATALNPSEQRGAALFVDRGRCVSCHSGPYLSDEKFHNVGLKAELVATSFLNANDRGAVQGLESARSDALNVAGEFSDGNDDRLPSAVGAELEGAFRTPRLRCVSQRPSFMHTGHMMSLDSVVAFFARGGDPGGYPGKNELVRLDLSIADRADLVAFLLALEGPGPNAELLAP